MVAANIHPDRGPPDVVELAHRAGTNPRTGTTEVEMAKALNAIQVVWQRGTGRTTAGLCRLLDREAMILLRTDVGTKHWVVLAGYDREGFDVLCPSRGRCHWTFEYAYKVWSVRDFDHFVVDRRGSQRRILPVHLQAPEEFLRCSRPPIPEREFGRYERDQTARVLCFAAEATVDPLYRIPYAAAGLEFYRVPRGLSEFGLVATTAGKPGERIGAILGGTKAVLPAWRGNGYGAELTLAAFSDSPYQYLFECCYFSEGGYQSRVAALRIASQRHGGPRVVIQQAVMDCSGREQQPSSHQPSILTWKG